MSAAETLPLREQDQLPTGPDGLSVARAPFGFRWFIPVLFAQRAIWRDVLLASLVLQLVGLATPLFTQVIIDKVIVHHATATLLVLGVALGIFLLFGALLGWMRQRLLIITGNRVDAVLGDVLCDHLLRLPPRWFEQRPVGVVAARMQAVETIRDFLAGSIIALLLDLPFLFIFVALMFWYSVPLTLMVLAVLLAVAVLSLAVAPRFQRLLNRQFLAGARNQAFITEYVAGMETVKLMAAEPLLRHRYRHLLGDYLVASRHTKNLANGYQTLVGSLEQLMTLLVLVVGAWLVMTGAAMTIGMLVAFQMFATRVSQPLLRLTGLWQQFQQARIAVARVGDIMDASPETYAGVERREARGEGRIELCALGFRYGEDRPFLYRNVSLAIPPGSSWVVLGASGSGKSTLARLLLGFLAPTEGNVRLDGIDVRHLGVDELRAVFGVVPQDIVLFAGTVQDNLLLGSPDVAFPDITAACRQAGIHEFIEQLPAGYQTLLGERGAGLSGGQRQRLAMARALLRRPRVLVLDEPFSHLDAQTAAALATTLNGLCDAHGERLTVLVITHQLPPTLRVDGVVRMGAGGGAGEGAAAGVAPALLQPAARVQTPGPTA
ncbi:MAG: peptidase domain-containing ABC transporter [Gammaproteobacteria bacterium]